MRFIETPLPGAVVIEPERLDDERGFFARTFSAREFEERGLESRVIQCSVSWNRRRGTLRGLHFQAAPHEEVKLVSCTQGAVWDVIVDVRPDSPTYRRWFSVELTLERRNSVYVPKGFAHGFQTLVDDSSVAYQMSEPYQPKAARGIRYDDPGLAIPWPVADVTVSARDAALPTLAG